jgi:hypothetical protein
VGAGRIEDTLGGAEPAGAQALYQVKETPAKTAIAEVADELMSEIYANGDLDVLERLRSVELVMDMSTRLRRRLSEVEQVHQADGDEASR